MAHAGDGVYRSRAGHPDRVGVVGWIFTGHQKVRISFSHYVHVGPGGGRIRRVAVHLRNAGFFGDCVNHRCATRYRNGGLFDGTCAAVDSTTAHFADRNAGRYPKRNSRTLGHLRDGAVAPELPFSIPQTILGWIPLFNGPIYGPCMLAGGIIIAVMILPIITSVSREILRSVPDLQREAAYALGATRWEATRIAVLSYAKKGLFGAVILGLGRALGETLAVTMVIGNTPQIVASLFKPGYTLASVIANEFTEATTDIYLEALFEIGLVLFRNNNPGEPPRPTAAANDRDNIINTRGAIVMRSKTTDHHTWRKIKSALASTTAFVSAILVILPLGLVFFHLLINGISSVNWDFFTNLPAPVGEVGGGMANAIVGTLELLALAGAIGIPVGVLGGVYFAEYGSARINSVLRFLADVLNGVPSITWGVVVYGLIVLRFKSFSVLAGGLALALIMIPLILRTTEEVVLLVPNRLSRSCARTGCQPVENNRPYCNEDGVQGHHHWHFAGVSTDRW